MLSTLAAGWLCWDPSSDPREVRDGAFTALWSCQLVSMQGLLGFLCSFAYHLPCARPRSGAVDENKQETEPKVWQAPHRAARELAPAPKGKKGSNSQP